MSDSSDLPSSSFTEIGSAFREYESFFLMSHVRPDGDAIGSQLALGFSLLAMGKQVFLVNEDGLPDNLAFLPGSDRLTLPPDEPIDIDVAVALDTGTKPRLGEKSLHAASRAKLWINIDHHKTNPGYGDLNLVDATSPSTAEILYHLITALGMPIPEQTRDAIYAATSTDTGSFRYAATTARTYAMAADLIDCGLDVGEINNQLYFNYPFRRIELMRTLLNSLQRSADGVVAHWELPLQTRLDLELQPEDSEGLIDVIRGIDGVRVAVFFEELPDGKIRISMRSKDWQLDVSEIAEPFGGGGHTLAAGVRMKGPMEAAKSRLLGAIQARIDEARAAGLFPD